MNNDNNDNNDNEGGCVDPRATSCQCCGHDASLHSLDLSVRAIICNAEEDGGMYCPCHEPYDVRREARRRIRTMPEC